MPALRIRLPNAEETIHVLRGERITIGRAPDNTIQIPHASISSHHAEFVAVDGKYELRDLHSTNRSYVEGKPVTETSLSEGCKILFGSVECAFEPVTPLSTKRMQLPPMAKSEAAADATFLESENRALRDHLHALQRRFDILGSARLVTGRADLTPYAAAGDALKSISAERDEFRQQVAGLQVQTDRLREELAVTARERDAARHAAEALQTERASLLEQLKKAQNLVLQLETLAAAEQEEAAAPAASAPVAPVAPAVPPKPPTAAPISAPPPPPGVARKAPEPEPPKTENLPADVRTFREILAQLSTSPNEPVLLTHAGEALAGLAAHATQLDHRALLRLVRAFQGMLRDFSTTGQTAGSGSLRTLRHAGELLTRLTDPATLAAGRALAPAQVLTVDDDADLLETVQTTLRDAGLAVSGCASAEEAIIEVGTHEFDTLIIDLRLPEMSGAELCTHTRELPTYRKTPILFLTVADTLDKRAETSLSGGSEFIAKPFNVSELLLKVECWTLKHQLRLV